MYENIIKKIKEKINASEGIAKMEKFILQFVATISSNRENFTHEHNRKIILKILGYLFSINGIKESLNAADIYGIFLDAYKKVPMAKIPFVKQFRLIHKEEFFLELVIPFISANQIDALIAALKTKLRKHELKYIQMVLNGLNIKIEKTFLFLRNIILKIINNNNENTLISWRR